MDTYIKYLITFFSAPTLSSFFFFLTILFIYLFLAVLGLHCCAGFSLVAVRSFSFQWPLLSQSAGSRALGLQWLQHMSSVVMAPSL